MSDTCVEDLRKLFVQHYIKLVTFPLSKDSKQEVHSVSPPLTAWSQCHRFTVAITRRWFQLFLFVIGLAIAFDGMSRLISLQSISSVKGKFFTFSLSQPYYSNVRKSDVIVGLDDLELFHNGCKLIPSSMKVIGSIISISFEDVIEFNSFSLHPICNKVSIEKSESDDGPRDIVPLPMWIEACQQSTDLRCPWPWFIQHVASHLLLSAAFLLASAFGNAGRFAWGRLCLAASHVISHFVLLIGILAQPAQPIWAKDAIATAAVEPLLHLAMAASLWGDLLDPYLVLLSLDALYNLLLPAAAVPPAAPTLPSPALARALLPAAGGLWAAGATMAAGEEGGAADWGWGDGGDAGDVLSNC